MAMHEIKKAMDEVKAFHAVDRHSEPLVSADVVAGAVKGMQMENRGRSTTRSRRDMGGSRSPARSRSPNRI